jgi:hypothetical protein
MNSINYKKVVINENYNVIYHFEYTLEFRFLQKVENPYERLNKKNNYSDPIIYDIIKFIIMNANKSIDYVIHDNDSFE